MKQIKIPKLAVWKFTSCDGCQLSILDLEDHLLEIGQRIEIAYFLEASSRKVKGPYDISLVEGSISTPEEEETIHKIRKQSKFLIAIGACATAGGIQALRNFRDVAEFQKIVYPNPEYIETLKYATPISHHVRVDLELRGCPINKTHVLEVISALLIGRKPSLPHHSVCIECKKRGNPCILVSKGILCMGPVTSAGCGAICPAYNRGCYGCFGPSESPNLHAFISLAQRLGITNSTLIHALRSFNAFADSFREASIYLEASEES